MAERRNLDRISRSIGSQPVVFENESVDALAGMVLSLLGEVMVLRDRLDANERLLQAAGLHGPADVDEFQPDQAATAYRAANRELVYDRVLGSAVNHLLPQQLAEQQAYEDLVDDVARD